MTAAALLARRLVLSSAEAAFLAARCAVELPVGFAAVGADDRVRARAAATLAGRGIVDSPDPFGCRPLAAVAANLGVLAAPVAAVRVEVAVRGRGLRAWYAVSGSLGGSLFALADDMVELSLFPAEALGRELLRAVPTAQQVAVVNRRLWTASGVSVHRPPAGWLPLAALAEFGPVQKLGGRAATDEVAASLALSEEEFSLAERVVQQTTGTLWCLVTGRGSGATLVGQVVWLATDDGWIGVRPEPDGTRRRMAALVPTVRADLGEWLAPLLAQILETADE